MDPTDSSSISSLSFSTNPSDAVFDRQNSNVEIIKKRVSDSVSFSDDVADGKGHIQATTSRSASRTVNESTNSTITHPLSSCFDNTNRQSPTNSESNYMGFLRKSNIILNEETKPVKNSKKKHSRPRKSYQPTGSPPQDQYMKLFSLAPTPIKLSAMMSYLKKYPHKDAKDIITGFEEGFPLYFEGPPATYISKNHLSATQQSDVMQAKIDKEVQLGRILGPFDSPPLPNFRSSAIGLVPKKSSNPDPKSVDNWRFIHDLSTYPRVGSVNEGIPDEHAKVQYQTFDSLIDKLSKLGKGALMAKADLKSAFRTLPMSPKDFHLMGFSHEGKFYVNVTMPMGAKISCSTYEKFSTFLHWCIQQECDLDTLVHYIDDFLFFSRADTKLCALLLATFDKITELFGVPTAPEKRVTPCTLIEFLGLMVDTIKQQVRVPQDKLIDIQAKIDHALGKKKLTLKEFQSLIGSLQFLCRAVAPGRPFIRRLTFETRNVTKPNHRIRLNKGCKEDLRVWKTFLRDYNGVTFFRDVEWTNSEALKLQTDASDWGMGQYFNGRWAYASWKSHPKLRKGSIELREILPIASSLAMWGNDLANKKVIFQCDNISVVHALKSQSSTCPKIMAVIRFIVLQALKYNITFRAEHLKGTLNVYADQISRGKFKKFLKQCRKDGCHQVSPQPEEIPSSVWQIVK